MSADKDADLSGFVHLGDALTGAMASSDRPLQHKGGRGWTIFDLSLRGLHDHAHRLGISGDEWANIERRAAEQYQKGVVLCESPIECMVLAALINADWVASLTIPAMVHDSKKDAELPRGDVVIVPQMAFVRFRLDFGVIRGVAGHKQIIGIECDGKEHHQDAVQQRTRDHYLRSWGIPVFHFTGEDIHRDPIKLVSGVAGLPLL
jgi:hypothetical protein